MGQGTSLLTQQIILPKTQAGLSIKTMQGLKIIPLSQSTGNNIIYSINFQQKKL